MKLVSVTIKNFRCYRDETTIEIGDLTTIIGKNDVGKSTILEALEVYFNNQIVKIDCEDCHVSAADDRKVEITCEFADPPDGLVLDSQAQTSLADEYLLTSKGTLCIKKTFKCTGAKPKEEVFVRARHPTADGYADLLELTNSALKGRLRQLGVNGTDVQLNSNPSVRRAIWNACPDLGLHEVELPVAKEDGKRIWEQLSSYLPMFALFQSDRASRDSDAEVQDPMRLAVSTALAQPRVREKLAEVVDAVREKAVELAGRTHMTLAKIDPDLAGQLTPEFKAEPKWAGLFSLALTSDQGIPINKRGSGVRRLILVSFFRAEAERRLSQGGSETIVYAIEEPETSQHPHNQRLLLESLQDLALEPGCQVLLTTHSPGLASYLPIDSFRFIQKGDDCQPRVTAGTEATWEAMVATLGVVPDNRVRVLLCVEGPTDVEALKYLSRGLHQVDATLPDLSTDPRVAFVVLGGGTLSHWVNHHYLKGLGRPEVHIYDNDVTRYGRIITQINARTDGSWGAQTRKREIENYLHPLAIQQGLGVTIAFGDCDDVPALVCMQRKWNSDTAKRKLAQHAFPKMTADLIRAADPVGEVEGWLRHIGNML
ncbi:MAG: ATP-binding protein [Anaerolineae bacterium]